MYGLQFKNNNEETQIDSKYRNHARYESGSDSWNGGIGNLQKTYFSSPTQNPPVVLISPGGNPVIHTELLTDSNGDYEGFGGYGNSASFSWLAYTGPGVVQETDYGIVVYDASGNGVFDSGKRYLKIASFQQKSIGSWSDYPVQFSVGDADNHYFQTFPLNVDSYYEPEEDITTVYFTTIKKIDSKTIEVAMEPMGQLPGEDTIEAQTSPIFLMEVEP